MRKYNEFIVWNHIFMILETLRGLYILDYVLLILGIIASTLSTLYHVSGETKYNLSEVVSVRVIQSYMLIYSILWFEYYMMINILCLKCLITFIYFVSYIDYEKIHPWLHVIVGIDAHIYINYYMICNNIPPLVPWMI